MTLHLKTGSMRAGKTTQLIKDYIAFKQDGKNVCIINYIGDIQRTKTEFLKSHDNIMVACLNIESFDEEKLQKYFRSNKTDIYMLNEGQFFNKLRETSIYIVESLKKDFYIYALDGDYKRENFGEIHTVLPLVDTYEKLYAKCNCGNKALFSQRIVSDCKQTIIGTDIYKSVCRKCYNEPCGSLL